ncbi:hybrid sensor histidine kinase/response regulator [Natrialba swarupiae]|uniref:PAS domain S-box protein n=1 Tax=Natrialba swarupiae TaxID=2448032 RepID=A0A5D5AQ03_9EURY|nr:GAF domain-containing protein [Natrialba swarupiae]TYT63938.1 PAS domain S-box protein [Natrialba swarupiae]
MNESETRVVYVDPDPAVTIQRALARLDATVEIVETAERCLSRLTSGPVHCVVTAATLHDADCVEFCRQVSAHDPDVSVVVCPADGSEALAGELLAAGVDGYVPREQGQEVVENRVADALTTTESSSDFLDDPTHADALEVLHETTRELLRAESTEEIATIVIEATEHVLDRPLAGVRYYDADAETLEVAATSVELAERTTEVPRVGRGDHVIWNVFAAGEPAIVEDVSSIEFPSHVERSVDSAVFHPLGEHGTLAVATTDGLDVSAIHLVHVLAATAEAALDRADREHELVDRKAKIETLHAVASDLDDCRTHQDVYDLTVEAAEDVLDFDVCVVDVVRDGMLVKQAMSSEFDDDEPGDMSIDEGIAGKTYRHGRTYRVDDLRANDDARPHRPEFRSVLSVPIGDRGVFQTVSSRRGGFEEEDQELAELLLSHVSDALERIDFEQRLRTERDRFAALFENVPDAVVVGRHDDVDADPTIQMVNPAFERIFGYDESELVGEPLDDIIVPSSQTDDARMYNRLSTHGEVIEDEVKRRSVDGLRDFMMRLVPVETDGTSETVFGVYTDVTERKRRRKRVEILNRVLRHDLRNGMNIVGGCAEMLAETASAETAQYAETIQERADELVELAEKTRAAEQTLERSESVAEPIDVSVAVENALAQIEREFPDADVDRSLPDRCFARADVSFGAAIYQVLENAIEHSDQSTSTVDVSLCDRPENGFVRLSIADDGPGIPDEERELLEEDREITQLRHASGLGLWLVDWAVTQSGGRLRFEENDPRGTVVVLEVPRAERESPDALADGPAHGED